MKSKESSINKKINELSLQLESLENKIKTQEEALVLNRSLLSNMSLFEHSIVRTLESISQSYEEATPDLLKDFASLIDYVYPRFGSEIKQLLPHCSFVQLLTYELMLVGITGQQTASLLGQSRQNIQHFYTAIANALEIDSTDNLIAFFSLLRRS